MVTGRPAGTRRARAARIAAAAIGCAWAALLAEPAAAEGPDPGCGTLSVSFENDTFADTDHYYTSGLRLAWTSAGAPPGGLATLGGWLARTGMQGPAAITWSAAIGQSIYASREVGSRDPPRDDRPFAGWLYATLGLNAATATDFATAELSLGVIGPAARGEELQDFVHTIRSENEDEGWNRQIDNRPAALLSLERRWAIEWARPSETLAADVVPAAGLQLGNVQTSAAAGFLVRFGRHLDIDFGPPRIRPALSGIGVFRPPPDWALYGFLGAEGRAVAYDATLDGNDDGYWRIDREPLVGELSAGGVLAVRSFRIAFTAIAQTATFEEQSKKPFLFGSLQMSYAF
jgi:hypothetical protein